MGNFACFFFFFFFFVVCGFLFKELPFLNRNITLFFLFLLKNIDCGYLLELPRFVIEAILTSTHNLCFEWKYEKYQNVFFSDFFHFLVVKFSVYLNRRVSVMYLFFSCHNNSKRKDTFAILGSFPSELWHVRTEDIFHEFVE